MFNEGVRMGCGLGLHRIDNVSETLAGLDANCPSWYFKAYPVRNNAQGNLFALRGFAKTAEAKEARFKAHQVSQKRNITKLIKRTGLHSFYATAIVRCSENTTGYYSEKIVIGILGLLSASNHSLDMPSNVDALKVLMTHYKQRINYNENTLKNIVLLLPKITAILNKPIK